MSKNIVFMVNLVEDAKLDRTKPYEFSVKSWQHYCTTHDCELYVLEDRIYEETYMNANFHKLFPIPILENSDVSYDKILVVDSDTIVHPDAPNIFDVTCTNDIYGVHNMGNYDWVIRSMENYSFELFDGYMFPLREYINTGLIVYNSSHKEFLREVHEFYFDNAEKIVDIQTRYGTGTDQPILNFLIHKFNQKLSLLPFEWNMQELPRLEVLDTDLTFTNYGYVYHFNGIPPDYKLYNDPNKSSVYQWMEYTYNKLYASK